MQLHRPPQIRADLPDAFAAHRPCQPAPGPSLALLPTLGPGGDPNRAGTVFGRPVGEIKAQNAGFNLADAVRGREFALDGVYGRVLQSGPTATVDELWGGAECRPR